MKRLGKIILAAIAAVAALYGCAKENLPEKTPSSDGSGFHLTFTAEKADDDVITRAAISAEDNTVINWSEDDAISVFDGAGVNCKFTLKKGAGSPTGVFEGKVTKLADSYTVLYPYQAAATIDAATGNLKGVSLKGEQTAVKGSFDSKAALMAAKSSDGSTIAFRNVVGYVKIACGFDCSSLIFSDNRDVSEMAGSMDIALNGGSGVPSATVTTNGRREVSLTGNIEAGAEYYIALLPGTLDKGFSLTFNGADGKLYGRSTAKSLTVKQGVVTNLGTSGKDNVEELVIPYITFLADGKQTFTLIKEINSKIDNSFEYSVNGGAWSKFTLTEVKINGVLDRYKSDVIFGGELGALRLRGKSLNGTSDGNSLYSSYHVQFADPDVKVRCNGDIRTLINYEKYKTVSTQDARFSWLFNDAVALVSAPELPITELATKCYYGMFIKSSIENAPELPATVLPDDCYSYMFSNCKQLKYSPDLKAKTVGKNAYFCMFQSCKALKKAPEILATEFIDSNNCNQMFTWCSALEEGPSVLYAETLQSQCYFGMFMNCSSLKKAPVIKAVNINGGQEHCKSMFAGCWSLETVQDVLFAKETLLFPNICELMFWGCTNLKKAPALPSMNLHTDCYQGMFKECTSLTEVPESLPATKLYERCYADMFKGCTKLEKAPKLPAETLASKCYSSMFENCSSLTEVWLNAKTSVASGLDRYTFMGCPSTGVTAHIRKDRDYKRIGNWLEQPKWTYVDITTGEPITDVN